MEQTHFNDADFNNNPKRTEKVHYKGVLRIVGQVVNKLEDKDPIGYVIMVEKTRQFKVYTCEQTKALLMRFTFVNAALENNKIINTECSMNRLPKFNSQLALVGNHGILVLGEITNGTTKIGYRIMDNNAKIIDVEESELIMLNNKGLDILNAKVVERNGRHGISAIKQEFTKIEKDKLNDTIRSLKDYDKELTPEKKWIRSKHLTKMINISYPRLVRKLFLYNIDKPEVVNRIKLTDDLYSRDDSKVNTGQYRYIDLDREYKVMCKEILKGVELPKHDKEILNKILSIKDSNRVGLGDTLGYNDKLFMIALSQFALYNKDCYNKSLRLCKSSSDTITNKSVQYLKSLGLCSIKLAEFYKDILGHMMDVRNRSLEQYDSEKKKAFNTLTFTSAKDIANLGFTIKAEYAGKKYKTDYGFEKTLHYLGKHFDNEATYEELKSVSRCLGDLASIAYIQKLLDVYGDLNTENGYANGYNMLRSDIRCIIEIIITIAYMYNSLAMKNYVEIYMKDEINALDIHVDYDTIADVDYNLNADLMIYYTSGFNVFLSDADNYNYKKIYLKNSKFINYRQLGIRHNIIHPLLQNDLASIVSMVSSENLDTEIISKFIGTLRFL